MCVYAYIHTYVCIHVCAHTFVHAYIGMSVLDSVGQTHNACVCVSLMDTIHAEVHRNECP
jgi:hypothetical protein